MFFEKKKTFFFTNNCDHNIYPGSHCSVRRLLTSNQIRQNLGQHNQDVLVPDLSQNLGGHGQDVVAAHGRARDVPPPVDGRLAASSFRVIWGRFN
jgi:hypothetical protein